MARTLHLSAEFGLYIFVSNRRWFNAIDFGSSCLNNKSVESTCCETWYRETFDCPPISVSAGGGYAPMLAINEVPA